jgi:hypothetical protein
MTTLLKIITTLLCFVVVLSFTVSISEAASRQVLKGEATGKVLLNGEPWGTGKVTFNNAGGDISFVVTCDKDISAGANSATCTGTNVSGWFSGGPNGYATFGSGSNLITLQLTDGQKFTYAQGGVTAELTVADPSIFDKWDQVDDEDEFEAEEYEPNAPLTDSGVRAADIDGQVEIACPPDFDSWNILKQNTIIYNHCRLKTGEESTLKVSFGDMSTFVMRPETQVVINQAMKEKSNFQLLFGGIWANVKKMTKGEEFGFKGSQAVAGIKGTTFAMEETGSQTTLKVIEGEVEYASLSNGDKLMVVGGETVTASSSGLSAKQTFNIMEESARWPKSTDAHPKKETAISKTEGINATLWIGLSTAGLVAASIGIWLSRKWIKKKG